MNTMAKQPEPQKEVEPLAELTAEGLKHIEAMGAELDESIKRIEDLEGLGFDMSRLKEHIEWSKKARDVVLKAFKK